HVPPLGEVTPSLRTPPAGSYSTEWSPPRAIEARVGWRGRRRGRGNPARSCGTCGAPSSLPASMPEPYAPRVRPGVDHQPSTIVGTSLVRDSRGGGGETVERYGENVIVTETGSNPAWANPLGH